MKIWKGYGTEHSANLVIVGNFKTIEDASKAKTIIEELTKIARKDEEEGLISAGGDNNQITPRFMDFISHTNFSTNSRDLEQLLYDYNLKQNKNELNLHTEEQGFQLFLNAMIHCGAKIEMFSAHNYQSKYGR